MPRCDFIIPALNSADSLPYTLEALTDQEIPAGWQARIILADDGSTDATATTARLWRKKSRWPLILLEGTRAGAAAARNRALEQTRADIIFFLGADIILRPRAVAAHLQFHERNPAAASAVLGMIKWDPRLAPTPLMEWMIHGGPQNDFDALLGDEKVPARYFYGSHLSLKRKLIGAERFSEAFGLYGWEDIEFGQRLARRGLALHVLPAALGLHRHLYSVAAIARRQEVVGRGVRIFKPHYRQWHWRYWWFGKVGGRLGLHWLMRLTAARLSTPWLFSIFTGSYFWQGVHKFRVDKMGV